MTLHLRNSEMAGATSCCAAHRLVQGVQRPILRSAAARRACGQWSRDGGHPDRSLPAHDAQNAGPGARTAGNSGRSGVGRAGLFGIGEGAARVRGRLHPLRRCGADLRLSKGCADAGNGAWRYCAGADGGKAGGRKPEAAQRRMGTEPSAPQDGLRYLLPASATR